MDVDDRQGQRLEELTGQNLHVASQPDDVNATDDELEELRLGLPPTAGGDVNLVERDAERRDVLAQIGVIGDGKLDIRIQLAAPPKPQDVKCPMVMPRDEQCEPLPDAARPHTPLHVERLGNFFLETGFDLGEGLRHECELHAKEEPPPAGSVVSWSERVMLRRRSQEAGDRGDDTRSI
jgi:hypothetical protein